MEQDKFALVEKILKDIENVMLKNTDLYAFDIVPVESNLQNKSPVLHLENCLGLESWCVKHVYMYCYSEVMDKYIIKPKRKTMKVSSVNSQRLASLLNVTLLLNPELCTFWNKRRELVSRGLLEKAAEMSFTKLVLSRKPKCNDAFSYRRWLLDIMLQEVNLPSTVGETIINEEFNVCQLASDKIPNNYHSWSHRMWLLNKLKRMKHYNMNLLYAKEYDFSERWTSKHISDFSCFHYRQFCINNVFSIDTQDNWRSLSDIIHINFRKSLVYVVSSHYPKDVIVPMSENELILCTEDHLVNFLLSHTYRSCNCRVNNFLTCRKLEILFHELSSNNELLKFYMSHETLWYHRRFIVHEILTVMYEYFGFVKQNGLLLKDSCTKCKDGTFTEKQPKIVRYDNNRIYVSNLFKILLSYEKTFIEEMQRSGDNYAARHDKYLKYIEGINN